MQSNISILLKGGVRPPKKEGGVSVKKPFPPKEETDLKKRT
jgi:hypothetical protein